MYRFNRFRNDFRYLVLNHFVNHIPCWFIRKFLYKLFGLKIGKNSRIGINTIIVSPKRIKIGHNTIINEMCYLDGRGQLEIGNNSSISFRTTILTATHNANSNDFEYYEKKVVIGNNVWLGANAIVLDGSIINNYAVIGAGSVFKGTANENDIYIGNPAKKIKVRKIDNEYTINYRPFFR